MPMCATGSPGHWLWIVMFVTFDPLRNALVYGVTTSSCSVSITT